MEKILFGWSGGKDSAMALYQIQKDKKYQVASLLTTVTEGYERVSLHGVRRTMVEKQALSLDIPLHEVFIPKSCSTEEYGARMKAALKKLKQDGIEAVAFGDIFLEEVRQYREENLARAGMKSVFPLWGRDSAELISSFIASGFQAVVTCIDSKVLDKRFLGRKLDQDFIAELPPNIDPSGENGEFHTFVYDGPIFKQRIGFERGETVLKGVFYFIDLIPEEGY